MNVKTLLAVLVGGFMCSLQAELTTYTWVGGSSGSYEDAANWDPQPATYPSGTDTALIFTNSVDVTFTKWIVNAKVTVAKGTVNFNTSTSSMRYKGGTADGSPVVYDVAKGAIFRPVNYNQSWTAYNASGCDIVVKGGGAVYFYVSLGESATDCPKSMDVQEGTVIMGAPRGTMNLTGTLTIRSGATFKGQPAWFPDPPGQHLAAQTKIVVEENGVLDYYTRGTFGTLSGAGTVKNSGSYVVTLRNTGLGGFSGKLVGAFTIAPENGEPFLVAGEETLMQLVPTIVEPEAPAKALAFAPGITYAVNDPTPYAAYATDVSGQPLTFMKKVLAGTTYTHTAAGDDTWPENFKLTGDGTVVEKSGGTWTIGNFAMTGGTFTLDSGATGTNVVFAGGTSTNVVYNPVGKAVYQTTFAGGDHHFATHLTGEQGLTYLQSAGTVWAHPLLSTYSSGSQKISTNDVFYTMTGGTLYSTPTTRGGYGLGLEVGGTAKAYLKAAGETHHAIAYATNHTVRVKDDGYLWADKLDFAHYGGGSKSFARVELLGGTMEVSDNLGYQHSSGAGSVRGRVLFDGGRLLAGANLTVVPLGPEWGLGDDSFMTLIGPNGGEITVTRSGDDNGLSWYGPFVSDVAAGETDGGLVKSGPGILRLYRDLPMTGPLTVRSGTVRNEGSGVTTPFGTGDVVIESGALSTVNAKADASAATDEGAALVYRNNANVELSKGLSVGAIRRDGHGVLFARHTGVNGQFGGTVKFRVTAGVANDATTGLAAQPVFSYIQTKPDGKGDYGTRAGGLLGFLTYDADVGFKNAATTKDSLEGTTSASVCEVGVNGHVDLTHGAAVGAVSVWAPWDKNSYGNLTIANGCTLTIGNGAGTIAPLLLNNMCHVNGQFDGVGRGTCIVQGGTVAFGAAEALVLANAAWRNYTTIESAYVHSKLTGTGGVTFAAPWSHQSRVLTRSIDVTGDNELSGGAWIEGVSVRIKEPTGVGMDTVTVEGSSDFGGRLVLRADYTGAEFAAPLVLAGVGPTVVPGLNNSSYEGTATQLPPEDGALSVLKSLSLTGGITLAKDVRVYVGGGATANIASAITGPGKLEVKGPGTLRLSAANSFSGGIVVREGSTLELAGAGTCGAGKLTVEKGATLRFVDRATIPQGFTFEGEGAVEFGAAPTGDESLVKTGPDRQILRARGDYTGATVIAEGTLCLDYPTPAELPCADKISFRLDASDVNTLTFDAETLAVSAWADADGGTSVFAQDEIARQPQYDAEAFGGRGAVFFPGTAAQQLKNAVKKNIETVFAVTCTGDETGVHPKNSAASPQGSWSYAPLIGYYGVGMNDFAIRLPVNGSKMNRWARESLAAGAEIRVNGVDTNEFAFGEEALVAVALASQGYQLQLALGESFCWPTYNYSYYGRIGEIVAYTGFLGEEERRMAEKYLMAKWGLIPEKPTVKDMLPPTTELEVAAGATLDLAGTSQTVKSMTLEGEIVNSASATLSVLRLEEGTSYVTGGSLGENIELQVWKNAILDLGGGTLEVDWVKCTGTAGDLGNIINGTLIVRKGYRRPYGGSLLIIR